LVRGPALLLDATATVVVAPSAEALVTADGDVLIRVIRDRGRDVSKSNQRNQPTPASSDGTAAAPAAVAATENDENDGDSADKDIDDDDGDGDGGSDDGDGEADAVLLSVFAHRFMSIAEQMGRVLQRTSVSTNIKERLDFSCALFGPAGGLVANAPVSIACVFFVSLLTHLIPNLTLNRCASSFSRDVVP
jgi:hypothetical protein